MREITARAYAKVNLSLDVEKKMYNGYHQVLMVMQSIGIYDELFFEKTDSGKCELFLEKAESSLPLDGSNLIMKAAAHLYEATGINRGVRITLKKNIPVEAGLAGGSADAAATLKGLNALFNLGLSEYELSRIGGDIGADIPFCLTGGTKLCRGIGEVITPLPSPPDDLWILLAKPKEGASTAQIYKEYDMDPGYHPDSEGMITALKSGNMEKMYCSMNNCLMKVTEKKVPLIKELISVMEKEGAGKALMSGSGPTVFGIYEDKDSMKRAGLTIKKEMKDEISHCIETDFADMGVRLYNDHYT